MYTSTHTPQNLSLTEAVNHASETSEKPQFWEEYSSFHDSFAEQLAYEGSLKKRSDFWHLNCI